MKIIITKGTNIAFSKIIIIKNGKEESRLPATKDFCNLDCDDQDEVVIKLKLWESLGSIEIFSFFGSGKSDVLYIAPTTLCKIWDFSNNILPYLAVFLLAIKPAMASSWFDWVCAGIVCMLALSIMTMKTVIFIPSIRRKLFQARWI